ncbi:hypothetical protein EDC94DRAFT_566230 [Helicostylum pulchrum]|uniref:Secreted protein n=1 Tax=Helicostylum pulchrum TaxID=562976 RepID=A0ABP9XPI5_9FUNG|nr:hypothetical protein EDC94DRAFT_566230 [Helicostylum pulchrum]
MVALHSTSLLFASIALLSSYVNAYGQIAQVVDANNFCVFLPPADSVDRGISDTEWNAQAFCIGDAPLATNAGKLNSGFIQSAHYLATDKYVQVTGKLNPLKERLNATDEGGQYDIKAPKGSSCAGWKFYVNLVEPAGDTYCMRCCNDDRSCNRGISEKGCAHIIPGDYSGPKSGSDKKTTTKKSPATTTTTTSTVKKTITTTVKKSTTTTTTVAATSTVTAPLPPAAEATTVSPITTATNAAATTSPIDVANDAAVATGDASSPSVSSSDTNISPAAPAAPADNTDNASSNPNVSLQGQIEDVSAQSVNGVEKFQPSKIAFALLIVVAMMV